MEAEARFPAMGTDVHVIVVDGPPRLLDDARDRIDDLERRWSRFLRTSEVSLLTTMAGRWMPVSADTLALVELAVEGARLTEGRFDPTVLGAVIRAGYDRTFAELGPASSDGRSGLVSGWRRIEVDPIGMRVCLPDGVGFDPGGIGKGLAADLVCERLLAEGASGVCVNVGGDLRVEGRPPHGESWAIDLEHPLRHLASTILGLRAGAVATTTRLLRTWGDPDEGRHHLIDPASGRSARSGLASATVIAARGWQAEVLAKAAFVAGLAEGLVVLARWGVDGVLVDDGGTAYPTAGLDGFTRHAPEGLPASVGRRR
jgi:FAD:protein FMN transferase